MAFSTMRKSHQLPITRTKRRRLPSAKVGILWIGISSLNSTLFTAAFTVEVATQSRTHLKVCRPHNRRTSTVLRASAEPTMQPNERAFRLVQFQRSVELQTATYRLTFRPKAERIEQEQNDGLFEKGRRDCSVEVLLTSMVHLGDRAYYGSIMREALSYDRVLFELIAGPDVSGVVAGGRRIITECVRPTTEQDMLARNYGLHAQLNCMNYRHLCRERVEMRNGDGSTPRWVLADLGRDQIEILQRSGGEKGLGKGAWQGLAEEVTRALVVGRQAGDKILPKFFPPLGSSLNKPALVLRALLWLAPCPEAEIMLLDWARTYPRAGGLSALASAIAESALAGDFFTARKLGFAQQLVSGQAGGGNWGQSDEVIIKNRNVKVVEETERAVADGCRKIMILYGGLHMQDLASQLCERFDASKELTGYRTAWLVPTRARAIAVSKYRAGPGSDTDIGEVKNGEAREGGAVAVFGDEVGDLVNDVVTRWGALAVIALGYVAIGAWDWTDTVEALARDLTSGGPPGEVLGSAFAVSGLYVARHAYLYYGLARWLVQWDQGLFLEDA